MIFGEMPVSKAEGAILAHSVMARQRPYADQRSYKIAKGTRLAPEHIQDLLEEGIKTVTVAQLEAADIHENAAALRVAHALIGPGVDGLRLTDASTGRVNLRAECAGVVELNTSAIHAVNRVNPGITVATVPQWHRLETRGLVATVKIIPYAVPADAVAQAEALAAQAIGYKMPAIATATLIETQVGREMPNEKGRAAIEARLGRLGVLLSERVVVMHRRDAIASALTAATGQLKLILTGSATSDIQDTAPAAVVAAGGTILHYGMPVDPGNLLFLGELGGEKLIGLPGCARSPALNGADWVIERVICGVPVTTDDITGMGVGGLLKEIPSRPLPRARIERD